MELSVQVFRLLVGISILAAVPTIPVVSGQSDFQEDWLAAPVYEPAQTVNAIIFYTVDRVTKTCIIKTFDGGDSGQEQGSAETVYFRKNFQLPQLGPCVWLRCTGQGVFLQQSSTACRYGNECLETPPASENREYACIKYYFPTEGRRWFADRTSFNRTYRLLVGFSAMFPYVVNYTYDNNEKTCSIDGVTFNTWQRFSVDRYGDCLKFFCTNKNLDFHPRWSKCVAPDGCADVTTRDCTNFQCIQTPVSRTSRDDGQNTLSVLSSWLSVDPPSCKSGPECLSVGESRPTGGCQEKICIAISPGLPELVTVDTGCSLRPYDDDCLRLDQTSNFYQLRGGRNRDTCVKFACVQEPEDRPWKVKATRVPAEYGCFYNNECFPEGVTDDLETCERRRCTVSDSSGSITVEAGCKVPGGEVTCRFPGETWRDLYEVCTCEGDNLSVTCVTTTTPTTTFTTTSYPTQGDPFSNIFPSIN